MSTAERLAEFYAAPLPDQQDPECQSAISRLQEMRSLASRPDEEPPEPGGLYAHQAAVVNIMKRYDRLFLLHEAGTGKTCTVGAVAELFKDNFRALREAPRHLALVQMPIKRAYVLVRGKDLAKQFGREIGCVCRPGVYITEREQRALKPDQQTHHLTIALGQWYEITTYKKFYNAYGACPPEKLKEQFSGTLIYVDEIHNLTFAPKPSMPPPNSAPEAIRAYARGKLGKELGLSREDLEEEEARGACAASPRSALSLARGEAERDESSGKKKAVASVRNFEIYNFLWRLFHLIDRAKVIVGSATPMSNSSSEIVPVVNLVAPAELTLPYRLPEGGVLDERKILFAGEAAPASLRERFERAITGRVSFVRAQVTGAVPEYLGDRIFEGGEETQTKVLIHFMSEAQTRAYNYAVRSAGGKEDADEAQRAAERGAAVDADSLFLKQRQTSTFAYPPSGRGDPAAQIVPASAEGGGGGR